METVYVVRNTEGVVIARHVRVDLPDGKKSMYWTLPDHTPGLGGTSSMDLPLYGAEILSRLTPGQLVLLVEGEKATRALWERDVPAVGTVSGSSTTPSGAVLRPLVGFSVVTWEDRDEGGYKHMGRSVTSIREMGGDADRLTWGSERGDDAADYFARGGTLPELREMVDRAPKWPTPALPPEPVVEMSTARFTGDGGRRDRARGQLYDAVMRDLGEPARTERLGAWWCCPFHAEDTPSFKVSTFEPYYRCFGCGAKGDVFTYLRHRRQWTFVDVLTNLAPERPLGVLWR